MNNVLASSNVQSSTSGVDAQPQHRRSAGWLAIAMVGVYLGAFVVLSSSINWPASLDLPAAEGLVLVNAEEPALLFGYWLYFAFSLAVAPLAVLVPRALGWRAGPFATSVVMIGAVSAVFRALGIARWLLAMPALADTYVSAAPGSATREAALVVYATLNDYAGGVGEILGVTITGAAFALLIGVGMLRWNRSRLVGGLGVGAAVALLLAMWIDLFIIVGSALFLVWMVALGIHLVRRPVVG